jgi:hypothetical protein
MDRQPKAERLHHFKREKGAEDVADIYYGAGDRYVRYADGDPDRLFGFEGLHAYADRQLWEVLGRKLNELRAAGRGAIRILDASRGPETWLCRCVTHTRMPAGSASPR